MGVFRCCNKESFVIVVTVGVLSLLMAGMHHNGSDDGVWLKLRIIYFTKLSLLMRIGIKFMVCFNLQNAAEKTAKSKLLKADEI